MVFVTALPAVARRGLHRSELRSIGTELLRDIATCDTAASAFVSTSGWQEAYKAHPEGAWRAGSAALEALYQQVHKLHDSLCRFVGAEWANQIGRSAEYKWYAAASNKRPATLSHREPARELAWLRHVCTVRNQAVQHRLKEGFELSGHTIGAREFSATYSKPRPEPLELPMVRRLLELARGRGYSLAGEPSGGVSDVDMLVSLAEQLHDLNPGLADQMRRAIIRSGVLVVFGSETFVRHLDVATRRLVEARYPD